MSKNNTYASWARMGDSMEVVFETDDPLYNVIQDMDPALEVDYSKIGRGAERTSENRLWEVEQVIPPGFWAKLFGAKPKTLQFTVLSKGVYPPSHPDYKVIRMKKRMGLARFPVKERGKP